MILRVGEWKLDIDVQRTMQYYAKESEQRCDCAYCRNFSAVVDEKFPDLRSFLVQFGVDIDTPDESMPYDGPGEMWYVNVYSVCGKILEGDGKKLEVDGVNIHLFSENRRQVPSYSPEPSFFLETGMIALPWVLDEPMEETISPANEPSFLEKMWHKLLSWVKNDRVQS
jgi:hypothetical protein